jgi:hypothetical protein
VCRLHQTNRQRPQYSKPPQKRTKEKQLIWDLREHIKSQDENIELAPWPIRGRELWKHINTPPATVTPSPAKPNLTTSDTTIPDNIEQQICKSKMRGLMWPTGPATQHPAFPLLQEHALCGCPVDCRAPWTEQQIQAALERGQNTNRHLTRTPHQSPVG